MMSVPLVRRMALTAGASAVIGMGMLTACSTKEKPAETPAPSSPSATAPASPTEKSAPGAITPGPHSGSGPQNSFAPTVTARPAPTALPGNVITGG
jgi:hypothetical protein